MDNRSFKGVWIPKEIWINDKLTWVDKLIFTEIDSLDNENHCTASNKYLASFIGCSENKVSQAISKLIKLGYISILQFDGRTRVLKSNLIYSTKIMDKRYEELEDEIRSLKQVLYDNKIKYR